MFVVSTFENLSQDMTRGQGEYLASLATMMGVPIQDQPSFFSLAQDRYRTLMERREDSPLAVIKQGNPRGGEWTSNACSCLGEAMSNFFSTEYSVSAIMRLWFYRQQGVIHS